MTVYEVVNTFIRDNKVGATAKFFDIPEEAHSYFSDKVENFHIKYCTKIKTGDWDETKTSTEYLLYDTNNPNDFTERILIVIHAV